MGTTTVFIEKTSTTATISWNASYIDDTLLEHYAHDIMYRSRNSDNYQTAPQKAAVGKPSFRLSNLEHNNNYIIEVQPYRLFKGFAEIGIPSSEVTFKTDCIGQYRCNILFIKIKVSE